MSTESREVVVTGLGPVTAAGIGVDACWRNIKEGSTRVERRALPVDFGVTVELPIATVGPDSECPGLEPHSAYLAEQNCEGSRDLAYSLLAMELALTDAKLAYDRVHNRIGLVQAFEAPGVERTVSSLFQLMGGGPPVDGPPRIYDLLAPQFYNMQPFVYVHLAAKAFGLRGYCTSVHNACSSGAFAIEAAAQHIRSGQAEIMLVAGGEAFDTAVRLEWFRRLDLYAHDAHLRPFDLEPSGFFVGEGAGAIVLESAAHATSRGAVPYAVYRGGAFAHQGWKQTIPDLRAARLRGVISNALSQAGQNYSHLDMIVPHGAATALSDQYEATNLCASLHGSKSNSSIICFKPFFGHLLAASGIVDLIGSLLCMKHQFVPGPPFPPSRSMDLPGRLPRTGSDGPVRSILKLSTGFTGHDAATIFARGESPN